MLAQAVARNLSCAHEFWCFTDDPAPYASGIVKRALPQEGLAGWWNKIALFKPGVFPEGARVLYLDLDTLITGSLDDIARYDGRFAMLGQFFDNVSPIFAGPQSGVMAWEAGFGEHIWQTYVNADYPDLPGGDQAFIRQVLMSPPDLWQERHPGRIVSFKQVGGLVPDGAAIACFHGKPAMHEVFPNANGWSGAKVAVEHGRKSLGGVWWPVHDHEAWIAGLHEVDDQIEAVLRHVPARRACIQAGGNVGLFAARLARHFETVSTFEPDPVNYACLELNVPDNVVHAPHALAGPDTVAVYLRATPGNAGSTHANVGGVREGALYCVEALPIDDLKLPSVDLIWLDVEGYEMCVLEGAEDTIDRHRPVIVIEENGLSERYGRTVGATTQWLIRQYGYRIAGQIGHDVILTPQ